jgi:hypothetical protein
MWNFYLKSDIVADRRQDMLERDFLGVRYVNALTRVGKHLQIESRREAQRLKVEVADAEPRNENRRLSATALGE